MSNLGFFKKAMHIFIYQIVIFKGFFNVLTRL